MLRVVVYYLCSLGTLNKDQLVDLLVVGKPARKVNKVFSFLPTAWQNLLYVPEMDAQYLTFPSHTNNIILAPPPGDNKQFCDVYPSQWTTVHKVTDIHYQ